MKKLLSILALALVSIATLPSHAQTATGAFNVLINLTSKCEINGTNAATGAVITDLALNYTSFQTTAATATTNFNIRCTDSLPYTLALSNSGLTDDAVDLAYTLALSAAGGTGTGANQNYVVTGTIAAGQAGKCAAGGVCDNTSASNKTKTLTVAY